MRRIAVLTGAGISAESGIKTFRAADGLWENHKIQDVASPGGFQRNRELVQQFYNARRAQLHAVAPNAAHLALRRLEAGYHVDVITQNIDDLHERAGSSNILHLHGELRKARSVKTGKAYPWTEDITPESRCPDGARLRPHVVWFGEAVPLIEPAARLVSQADTVIIIGTSMQVYPAAGLVGAARKAHAIYYVDPHPTINHELANSQRLTVIEATAVNGVPPLVAQLLAAV